MERPFYPEHILISLKTILPFLPVTLAVVTLTVLFSFVLALLLVFMKLNRHSFLQRVAGFYIHVTRCTPSIVMLFIVFYGIPKFFMVIFGVNLNFWPKIIFVVIALSLLYSATLSEIIRSAYLSIDRGQKEAGLSLGLPAYKVILKIIVPQAAVIALPNLGNSFIALLKEGSLAYTIGLIDVMGSGNLIISRNYGGYAIETYIALSIVYWSLTVFIERLFKYIEKKCSRGRVNAV